MDIHTEPVVFDGDVVATAYTLDETFKHDIDTSSTSIRRIRFAPATGDPYAVRQIYVIGSISSRSEPLKGTSSTRVVQLGLTVSEQAMSEVHDQWAEHVAETFGLEGSYEVGEALKHVPDRTSAIKTVADAIENGDSYMYERGSASVVSH